MTRCHKRAVRRRRSGRIFGCAVAVLAASFAAAPPAARAWGPTGHMIVAQIAYDQLDERARREVDELILVLAPLEPHGDALAGDAFVPASTWMDALKGFDFELFNRWHYVNNPLVAGGTRLAPPEPLSVDNVVWAIRQSIDALRSPRSAHANLPKALALRFLIHLVGDVHQPLHCVNRVSDDHPAGDRGGNDFPLVPVAAQAAIPCEGLDSRVGDADELHALWDETVHVFPFVSPADGRWQRCVAEFARTVVERVPKSAVPRWTEPSPERWAAEGYGLARDVVYAGIEEGAPPSAEYLAAARPVVIEQLALAGYRLGALLDSLFGAGAAPAAGPTAGSPAAFSARR